MRDHGVCGYFTHLKMEAEPRKKRIVGCVCVRVVYMNICVFVCGLYEYMCVSVYVVWCVCMVCYECVNVCVCVCCGVCVSMCVV